MVKKALFDNLLGQFGDEGEEFGDEGENFRYCKICLSYKFYGYRS